MKPRRLLLRTGEAGRARWSRLLLALFCCLAFTTPLLAAEEAGHGWGAWDTVGRFFNLFLLGGIIIYFVRRPLALFFESRRREAKEKIADAQRRHQEAAGMVREIELRMGQIEQEVAAIRQAAQQEMRDETRRLEEATRQEGEKILAVARREIDGMVRTAHKDLRRHAASLSVSLAENMIRGQIGRDDQERILDSCLREMEGLKQ